MNSETITCQYISYQSLEMFISDQYPDARPRPTYDGGDSGQRYDLLDATGWFNDTDHLMDIQPFDETYDEEEQEEVRAWALGKSADQPNVYYVLQDLCTRGVIDAGKYLVEVSY